MSEAPEAVVEATKRRAGVLCFRPAASSAARGGSAAARGGLDEAASECGEEACFEFLLISRRSKTRKDGNDTDQSSCVDDKYTIPAGKFEVDSDLSCEDCALREAHEEAGIECEIVRDIGWHASRSKHNQPIQTRYFLAVCIRILESWLEDGSRERIWLSPGEALKKVGYREDLSSVVRAGLLALRGVESKPTVKRGLSSWPSRPSRPSVEGDDAFASPMSWASDAPEVGEERYVCYTHQVGGHFCMVKPAPGTRLEVEMPLQYRRREPGYSSRNGSAELCVVHGAKVILKPFNADEERFYCQLSDGALSSLLPFTPLFYGTKRLRREQIETLAGTGADVRSGKRLVPGQKQPAVATPLPERDPWFLVLEDLGTSASRPCFLDLKIGCRQRAARHNAQKRAHMASKAAHSTSAALGFRICGMQCYNRESGTVQRYDKYWGQKVTSEKMKETLAMFFTYGSDLITKVVDKLERLEAVVSQLRGMRFWGSSLLVFFDAAHALREDGGDDFLKSVRLKIIDFANFMDVGGDSADEEYLCGITNARIFLQALLAGGDAEQPLAERLVQPPSPELQDVEQERAWQELQRSKSRASQERRDNFQAAEEAKPSVSQLETNAQTISGATGRTLLRELVSNALVRVPEEKAESSTLLDELFKA